MRKFLIVAVLLLVSGQVFAAGIDCTSVTVNQIVLSGTGSIMMQVSSGSCSLPDDGHICLDNSPENARTTNLMYAHAFNHYMQNKPLSRLSIDTAIRPTGCGYSVVTEMR